jgi:hypothetical protein
VANRAARRKAARSKGRKRAASEHERILSLGGVRRRDMDAMHEVALERFSLGIGVLVREEHRHQVLEDSLAEERRRTSAWAHPIRAWRLWRAEARERRERQVWNGRIAECAEAVAKTADLE